MEVTEKVVVFPYVFDYLLENKKGNFEVHSLNTHLKKDVLEEKARNLKVQ